MNQILEFGWGSPEKLPQILVEREFRKPLFISGDRSFELSGAHVLIDPLRRSLSAEIFTCGGAIPESALVTAALRFAQARQVDSIVAIGGGMVMDVAKLVGIMLTNGIADPEHLSGATLTTHSLPIVAVPTTSGSGSEATHFAVLYVGQEKQSISHPSMLPAVALVDPELTLHLPSRVTATSGVDAISQAIESFWAVQSTEESRTFSETSLTLSLPAYLDAVQRPTRENRTAMSEAAHLSGKAINITKTTAPHALSYTLTSQYRVPHGEAVALTLPHILVYNSRARSHDYQGSLPLEDFQEKFSRLFRLLGVPDAESARAFILKLVHAAGLRTRLSEISSDRASLIRALCNGVNPERMSNNPRRMTLNDLEVVLTGIDQ